MKLPHIIESGKIEIEGQLTEDHLNAVCAICKINMINSKGLLIKCFRFVKTKDHTENETEIWEKVSGIRCTNCIDSDKN